MPFAVEEWKAVAIEELRTVNIVRRLGDQCVGNADGNAEFLSGLSALSTALLTQEIALNVNVQYYQRRVKIRRPTVASGWLEDTSKTTGLPSRCWEVLDPGKAPHSDSLTGCQDHCRISSTNDGYNYLYSPDSAYHHIGAYKSHLIFQAVFNRPSTDQRCSRSAGQNMRCRSIPTVQ